MSSGVLSALIIAGLSMYPKIPSTIESTRNAMRLVLIALFITP